MTGIRKQKQYQQLLEWRRSREFDLLAKGLNQTEIGVALQLSKGTVSLDMKLALSQAKEKVKSYIERIPFKHEKNLRALDMVLKNSWILFDKAEDNREKLGALSTILQAVAMREEALAHSEVISQGLQYVDKKNQESNEIRAEAAKIHAEVALELDTLQKLAATTESESKEVPTATAAEEVNQHQQELKENNDNP